MTQKLNFQCGRCGRGLTVDQAKAGRKGRCPHCRSVFTIPPRGSGRRSAMKTPRADESAVEDRPVRRAEERPSRCTACQRHVPHHSVFCLHCGVSIVEGDTSADDDPQRVVTELEGRLARADEQRAQVDTELGELREKLLDAVRERDRMRQRAEDMELARQEALKDYKAELLTLYETKEALESRARDLELRLAKVQKQLGDQAKHLESTESKVLEQSQRAARLEHENQQLKHVVEAEPSVPDGALPEQLAQGVAELEYRLQGMFDHLRNLRKQLSLDSDDDDAALEEYEDLIGDSAASEPRQVARVGPPPAGLVDPLLFADTEQPEVESPSRRKTTSIEVKSYRDIRSIGLDFGTTNSLLSYYKGVSIQGIFQVSRGEREGYRELVLPSTIGYLERENKFVFGYEAEDIPGRTMGYRKIRSIKRCLLCDGVDAKGHCANIRNAHNHDICGQGMGPWRRGGRRVRTEEIIAEYLHEVFRRIERYYDVELTPEKINFTVPIYFGYVARKKLRAAIKLAFGRLRGPALHSDEIEQRVKLIHEPTAAAISQYNQFRDMPDEVFAMFDMGGGTTDVAIYEKRRDNLWCLAADSAQVGGDDLDQRLLDLIERKMAGWQVDRRKTESRRVLDDFLENLTAVREALSAEVSYEKVFHFPEGDFELSISLEEFENEIGPVVGRSVRSLAKIYDEVLPILETFEKSLSVVYLVGGATKTPLVRKALMSTFAEKAPDVAVRPVSRFVGISAPHEARQILEEEFNIVSVAIGAGFPETNFREYLLDKVPFEIGVVINRDEGLDPLAVPHLVPFYKACEPVPHRCSRRLKVSQNPGNRLNIYMKREGQAFYKIIKYLKFPIRVGEEIRYLAGDKICDLSYEIAMEITKDLILVDFDGLLQEKATIPGTHPYYLQRDIQLDWVSRLSVASDFNARWSGRNKQVRGERTQDYLRRHVKESHAVELVTNHDGRTLVLHRGSVIGVLRGNAPELPSKQAFVRLLREDILLPEDLDTDQPISRSFRPGDQIIVFDIGFPSE